VSGARVHPVVHGGLGARRIWRARAFSEAGVVVLAAAVVAGAWVTFAAPVWVTGLLVAIAWTVRRPVLLVAAVPLLAGSLATQAIDGARPAQPAIYRGVVTLVSDPAESFGAARADVRADGHRYELWARGRAGQVLRERLAGERVVVEAVVAPRSEHDDWLLVRHIIGKMTADQVRAAEGADPVSRSANAFRRVLERGASVMDPDERALFAGFVLGDGRHQSDETIDDFRASGLSHLLVVSGENVAFVLAAIGPVLRRVGLRARLVAVVGALAFFAVMTRFEPSVLRAVTMTIIATWGTTIGRGISGLRSLALAVAALVLIDPLLVRSVGFQLSAAASLGIILFGRGLCEWLPGPRVVRETLGITLAAQAGVAPILVPVFGGVPVASLPANLLALPAAGPVMIWGLTAGTVAGLLPTMVAELVHVPTRALLWWVDRVATVFAALPLGELGWPHLTIGCCCAGLVVAARRAPARPRVLRAVGLAGLLAVAVSPAVIPKAAPRGPQLMIAQGAEVFVTPDGDAVILMVDGRARLASVLASLRALGVRSIDVLVVRSAAPRLDRDVDALAGRLRPGVIVVQSGSTVARAEAAQVGDRWSFRGLTLVVTQVDPQLEVDVSMAPGGGVASARVRPDHLDRDRARARSPPVRHHPPRRGHGHPQPHARLVLRQGQLLGLRPVPHQGGTARRRRRRLPGRRRGQGGSG